MLFQRSLKLFSFKFFYFIFGSSNYIISIILPSRSLIHSSVSCSLQLIPPSVFFILVIIFFSYDWFFWFSSPLLKFTLGSSILFLNSVSILNTGTFNSLSNRLFISVSLVVFSGVFSCSFSWYRFLCILVLLTSLCLYETRWTVTLSSLEQVHVFGSIPIQFVGVQRLWWNSWTWCEQSQIFSMCR